MARRLRYDYTHTTVLWKVSPTHSDVGGFVYLERVTNVQGQGDKSGNLNVRVGTVNKRGQVKPGSKWVYAYFLVSGGSLHFYIRKEVREAVSFFAVCA